MPNTHTRKRYTNVKRTNGVYFTTTNPFNLRPFKLWAEEIKLNGSTVLEPFAGGNNIIKMLKCHYDIKYDSFDTRPCDPNVCKRDTLANFPKGYDVCITNPPWLYLPSARRRGLHYPDIKYDDLYKHCLDLTLQHCANVCFIIPATYLQTGLFRKRLHSVVFVHERLFSDTDNPVCLAMFAGKAQKITKIYNDNTYLGTLSGLAEHLPKPTHSKKIVFNADNGNIGLVSFDNTIEPTIHFCGGDEIHRKLKHSDRMITKIRCDVDTDTAVEKLNYELNKLRKKTHDVFLTPFKGLRHDGFYRRRINFSLVRDMINAYC